MAARKPVPAKTPAAQQDKSATEECVRYQSRVRTTTVTAITAKLQTVPQVQTATMPTPTFIQALLSIVGMAWMRTAAGVMRRARMCE